MSYLLAVLLILLIAECVVIAACMRAVVRSGADVHLELTVRLPFSRRWVTLYELHIEHGEAE